MEAIIAQRRNIILNSIYNFAFAIGYPLSITRNERILGPRIQSATYGTELFISRIPTDMFEDELMLYFSRAGPIYKMRLTMCVSGVRNRGDMYVTYETQEAANLAIRYLHKSEIKPGYVITVIKSTSNKRLFIGGIPESKTRSDVWEELMRIGMRSVVDLIMYRSYNDQNMNRRFVFVEFACSEEAMKVVGDENIVMFGKRVQINWAKPVQDVESNMMNKVKKLFLRNLNINQGKEDFANMIYDILQSKAAIKKIHKYRDYAFLHFRARKEAERSLNILREYFKNTNVEVTWAKPILHEMNNNIINNGKIDDSNRNLPSIIAGVINFLNLND